MNPNARITITPSLPTGSATSSLFDSTVNSLQKIPHMGAKWFVWDIYNDQTGTVKGYWSINGGTTWRQFYSSAVAIPVAGTTNQDSVYIEPYLDVKFEWVNGGSNQTAFDVNMALSIERAKNV